MLRDFFATYPYVFYSIITWGLVFIFLGFKAVKRLYPAAILGAITIFCASYWLVSVGVYKFNAHFLAVLGIPLFHAIWGAANGIIFAYFFGEKIYQRFLSILIFAGVTVGVEKFIENVKSIEHLGKFTDVHEYFFDVFVLAALGFIIVSLMGSRLKKADEK